MTNALDREHASWVGRKTAALRRPTLDCGHRNAGDVYFHMWCDRLSCSTVCAETVHDCREYKGGIEEESAPVEPETETTTFELAPGTTVTMPAVATVTYEITNPSFTLADMEAASAAVRALHAPPVDAALEELEAPVHCPTCGHATEPGVGPCDGCTDWLGAQVERRAAEATTDARPWWRRMLGAQR